MNKKLMVIGIVLIFIGVILIIGFWPLIGKDCQTVEDGSYSNEDSVIIYGEIDDMKYFSSSPLKINGTLVTLEKDFDFWIVNKDVTDDFEVGDQIYATIVYNEVDVGITTLNYWTSSGINSTSSVNLTFFIILTIGATLIMIGAAAGSIPKKS